MANSFTHLSLTQHGAAAVIAVNRPDQLNALSTEVLSELLAAIESVATQPVTEIAGVVLIGAGDRAFIAGADISEMSEMTSEEAGEFAALGQQVPVALESLDRPSIAAVNGYALGGGCEMALGCDFIYASEAAVFGQPEVLLGLIPSFGGCARLPARVGVARARELIVTGRRISASEGYAWGLVNQVFPDRDAVLAAAIETVNEIGTRGPLAVQAARTAIQRGHEYGTAAGLAAEVALFADQFQTSDMREGTAAFLEKRPARFTGQ